MAHPRKVGAECTALDPASAARDLRLCGRPGPSVPPMSRRRTRAPWAGSRQPMAAMARESPPMGRG